MPTYSLFATTPKAMEDILAAELQTLGIAQPKATLAGVAFAGDLETAYRVCLWSRTANRVLLVLATFPVKSQQDLYDGVQQIDWFTHINPEDTLAVSFSAKNSEAINNTHFGALKVKDAIVDQMRSRFNVRPGVDTEQPNIRINVYLQGETAQLSLDLSGESLHRRGYRDTTIKAPIKENLAAALLLRCGWPKLAAEHATLLDPMCGSGTLLLEGAMMAADYAPGLLRDYFGFTGWKQHDAACWRKLRTEAEQRKTIGLAKLPVIVGFDQDRYTVNIALKHIANAGLAHKIHVERRDIADAAPAESWQPGLVICNPPYGERLEDEEAVAELYRKFGETLKSHFLGWQVGMIISNPELGFRLGIRSQKPITLFNGALECRLLRLNINEAAFFVPKARNPQERVAQVIETSSQAIPEDTGADMFANRLKKNLKKLSKWAQKNAVTCYRIYDADLPEYAAAVDLYQGEQTWVNVQEYEPPKTVDRQKADQRLAGLLAELPKVLDIPRDNVFLKIRRKQRNTEQYEKFADSGQFHRITEGGCTLLVNFADYLDTGLFLDHRPIRLRIQREAKGKRFLNLFAYTGSATVHAAVGGAIATTTVDMSNTYINWAKQNLALNKTDGTHEFIQADCLEWLASEAAQASPRQYGLIFLDPPTFSNSKRMDAVFDIQNDYVTLIRNAAALLAADGVLYFSTNFRRFKMDAAALPELAIDDISADTIPEDFARHTKIHYCWRLVKLCVE
ncbi:bifunctional 23S rRNA (guanine(2069)-N(7))-methyltransferase RlmK/23S rRNA (guanine(2445)-N(2))-methyltransferase RlmL [Methylovulum psychrotolerans]|uniref:bifunctional 23S rRNA (guanine(2069)-N(7))-methyltransferase RlmK/23S rRNA (guanine(2445)-N(2))-methyltransferase RlmL n=1 Tax=Methylovulum psychrotolerans TaxID=1704499 RepID=UPI001BFF5637|nr:bifunctional 23S rRNA (guanine(2069)-N(7))-methyltransferase RlmK/23S rRNA (guanine(2445)-N(2))-methyltransferase RlmL [Methylovulum psychrotolerans]MBT9097703.1 bifunctional 23S rRNA (guanine(2069)-N(7))-methyltransferase RlmK/23S rRNA (guanine(2445)-N(2))-methyltransferase RlmL [Methylovulum psychrotolerans]